MGDIPLSILMGGGSILITILFFVFKGNSLDKFKKIFNRDQNNLKNKIKDLEIKEAANVIKVKEAEEKVIKVKERAAKIIQDVKKEVDRTGSISDPEKLLEKFNQW